MSVATSGQPGYDTSMMHAQQYQQPQPRNINLAEAIRCVNNLDELPLADDVPAIEAASIAVQHQVSYDTNFEDCDAYVTGMAKYMEEARVHAELNKLLEEGQEYAVMLYTWRCSSRALPHIKSNEQPNRIEIYQRTVQVLGPYVQKLMNFMYFQKNATKRFAEECRRLCHREKRNDFVSEAYLITLGKLLNMFAVLDELKNMKASMKNDYSHYKRAAQFLHQMTDPETLDETQTLTLFLAKQYPIRDGLKEQLLEIPGFEDLLADVINTCVFAYENKFYLTPSEKHLMVKVIGYAVQLIDTPDSPININKLDKKKIHLSKIDRILKQCEVVNLYGDMNIQPFFYIKKTPNYDPSKWPECNSNRKSTQGDILDVMPHLKEDYASLVADLARHSNVVTTYQRETARSDLENKELCDLALKCLQHLGTWNLHVLDMYIWKLAYPVDVHQNQDCPRDAEDYEKATRYNYNSEEKFALVEVIGMIKSVQALMLRIESIFTDAIKRTVYRETQEFVQLQLREPLRKAGKKGRETIRRILMAVKSICADQVMESADTDQLPKSRRDNEAYRIRLAKRGVGPSSTQLYMVRTMLESLIDRSGGKHTLRKDMDASALAAIDNFHKTSFFWSYLLNFNDTLHQCCDLAQLWYREFYLEMTNGNRIQFPIEMSIPWILTDHVLESRDVAYTEYLLYPMDLYNDSAYYALTHFKRRFLYDEIESEVNLVFDQLVYKLSDQIFTYYKQLAASILLDKRFRMECTAAGLSVRYPAPNRYTTLMKQRHVQLLGRSLDLNRLISQRINKAMLQSLDSAIGWFTSQPLTAVVELEALIDCNRLCHRLLAEHLALDDFDQLLTEADQRVTANVGQIGMHVFWEVIYDLVPNFCYNGATNRFVRTPLSHNLERSEPPDVEPQFLWGSKVLNSCYNTTFKLYSKFIGPPHFRAICRFSGYKGIAVIFEETLKIITNTIQVQLTEIVKTLIKCMPPRMKLQSYAYGSDGIFKGYLAQLERIYTYSDLRIEVFNRFRELGNTILFCLLMEHSLTIEENVDLKHAAAFQSNIPKPFVPIQKDNDYGTLRGLRDRTRRSPYELRLEKEAKTKEIMKDLEKDFAGLNTEKVICLYGNKEQAELAADNALLTRERLCCGLSMFEVFLQRIKEFLEPHLDLWNGPPPANGVMKIEECTEFHRLWSAMQFSFCIARPNEMTVEQLYGEGLNWAGCTLISLLGQERRFEALDVSYHVLRVNKYDRKDAEIEGTTLMSVVDRIRKFQILNSEIFSTLNKYLRSSASEGAIPMEHVHLFEPSIRSATGSISSDRS